MSRNTALQLCFAVDLFGCFAGGLMGGFKPGELLRIFDWRPGKGQRRRTTPHFAHTKAQQALGAREFADLCLVPDNFGIDSDVEQIATNKVQEQQPCATVDRKVAQRVKEPVAAEVWHGQGVRVIHANKARSASSVRYVRFACES